MKLFKNYLRNEAGVLALVFALSIPVIIGSVGIGADLSQAYHTKNKLEKTLDAAVLAGASTNLSGRALEDFIRNYVETNFRETDGSTIDMDSLVVTENEDEGEIILDGVANSENNFLSFFGYNNIDVAARSVARERLNGVEVVLVLDASSSMRGRKMEDLRAAANDFVDTMYRSAEENDGRFRLGIVPYGSFVNVGPFGLAQNFVRNPLNLEYTSSRDERETQAYRDGGPPPFDWSGCVLEHDMFRTGTHEPMWDMHLQCHDADLNRVTDGGWFCRTGRWINQETCTGQRSQCIRRSTTDCTPRFRTVDGQRIPNGENCACLERTPDTRDCDPNPRSEWVWISDNYVNVHAFCPESIIFPMVDHDEADGRENIENAINDLRAGGTGEWPIPGRAADVAHTHSELGMGWGMHLLSPEAPFTEGSDWGSDDWVKVLIFMTDGEIDAHPTWGPYYPLPDNHTQRTERAVQRFEEMCQTAQNQGVLVFTVQFEDGGPSLSADLQDSLRACASGPDRALRATNGAMLRQTFEDIAEDLGTIFLAR